MPWWGWIVIGAVLLIAEVLIGTDFWLVFFGAAALAVGILRVAGLPMAPWAQWLAFGATSILALLLLRRRLAARFRHPAPGGPTGASDLVGESGVARESVEPGGFAGAEIRGTVWKIRNAGARPLAAGDRFRVDAVEGLTLQVRGED